MATIRQQLVDLVRARVAAVPGITGAFVWRVAPYAQDELPSATVLDLLCESHVAATNVHEHRLQFAVDIYAGDIVTARTLVGLLLEALRVDLRWTDAGIPLAKGTEPLRDSLETTQDERFIAHAHVEFVVVYRTPVFNPSAVYP